MVLSLAASAIRIYLDFSLMMQTLPTSSERHRKEADLEDKPTFFSFELEEDG